jgi:hypothetical protein
MDDELTRFLQSAGWASGCSLPASEERSTVEFFERIGREACDGSQKVCRTSTEFVLIDDPHLIAKAAQPRDKGYVMISAGTILLLQDLFYRILAHPDSYPNIGHPSAASVQPFHGHGIEKSYANLANGRGYGIDRVRPRDAERSRQAEILTLRAFHFLVLHELAHIEMGHLVYRGSQRHLPLISEFDAGPPISGGTHSDHAALLERQAMEMQADWWAAINTAHQHILAKLPEGFLKETFATSRIADPLAQAAFDLMFAVACLFAILNDDFDSRTAVLGTHPPAVMRVDFIVTHLVGPSPNPPPEQLRPYRKHLYSGANLAFRCIKLIGGLSEVAEQRITEAFAGAAFPMHAIHIEQASAALIKKLEPFDARVLPGGHPAARCKGGDEG